MFIFYPSKLRRSKYVESTSIFLLIEIAQNKVYRNNVDFLPIEIMSKKLLRNDVDFSHNEITSKMYVEVTWKFIDIFFLTYRRNIDINSMTVRCGVYFGTAQSCRFVQVFELVQSKTKLFEIMMNPYYFCNVFSELRSLSSHHVCTNFHESLTYIKVRHCAKRNNKYA